MTNHSVGPVLNRTTVVDEGTYSIHSVDLITSMSLLFPHCRIVTIPLSSKNTVHVRSAYGPKNLKLRSDAGDSGGKKRIQGQGVAYGEAGVGFAWQECGFSRRQDMFTCVIEFCRLPSIRFVKIMLQYIIIVHYLQVWQSH